jgi:hypothetical protein
MERPPTEPLNYASTPPTPPTSEAQRILKLLAGLGVGTGVSAIIWIRGWAYTSGGGAIWFVPVAKVIVATIFFCIPRWRSFGGGILLSVGLGALIFMGQCFKSFLG